MWYTLAHLRLFLDTEAPLFLELYSSYDSVHEFLWIHRRWMQDTRTSFYKPDIFGFRPLSNIHNCSSDQDRFRENFKDKLGR